MKVNRRLNWTEWTWPQRRHCQCISGRRRTASTTI